MNKRIKNHRWMFGLAAASCALGVALPARVSAEVSDADFNALKDLVQQMNGKLQALVQTNQQDQVTIHQLQQQLADTQRAAADAQQKSVAAAETQPVPRTPIDEATVNHNFQILGDAEFQYDKVDGQHGSFLLADFAPIFLYRGGDNVLFEAGFDTFIQNNATGGGYSTTFNLSFAQLDYVLNDYITLCAGDILLPLGTYTERGAGWLNKIPDDPLAVDALIPGTGVGAQLRGAIPVGDAGKFINYSVYGVNGPSSADGTGNAGALDLGGNVGLQSDGATVGNLHSNPAGGARVGLFLPFKPHYDLEVGLSGMAGEWDNAGNHIWVGGVVDAALHLGPNFEAKGEYIATKYGSDDLGNISQNGWFAQVGYKLAGLNLEVPVVNNVELVGRYDSVRNGYDGNSNSFHFNTQRYTLGGIYYFSSTLLFEADYEFLDSNDPSQVNQLILQLSYGF